MKTELDPDVFDPLMGEVCILTELLYNAFMDGSPRIQIGEDVVSGDSSRICYLIMKSQTAVRALQKAYFGDTTRRRRRKSTPTPRPQPNKPHLVVVE